MEKQVSQLPLKRQAFDKLIFMIPELQNLFIDAVLFGLPIMLVWREKGFFGKQVFEELGFRKISFNEMAKQTALILAMLVFLSIIIAFIATSSGLNDLQKVDEIVKKTINYSPFLFAYLLTVRVISEEIFFRGFLVPRIGALPSTILFASGHAFFGSITEIAGAFILGLVLAWFFEKNRNIFPNILAHFLYNIFAIVVFF